MKKLLVHLFLVSSLALSTHSQAASDITGMNDKLEEAIKSNPNLKNFKMELYNFKLMKNISTTVFNLKAEDGIDLIPQTESSFAFYRDLIKNGTVPIIAIHRTNSIFIESMKMAVEEKASPK